LKCKKEIAVIRELIEQMAISLHKRKCPGGAGKGHSSTVRRPVVGVDVPPVVVVVEVVVVASQEAGTVAPSSKLPLRLHWFTLGATGVAAVFHG
jgi:hypothetical protein